MKIVITYSRNWRKVSNLFGKILLLFLRSPELVSEWIGEHFEIREREH